jgi:hypothetical protein
MSPSSVLVPAVAVLTLLPLAAAVPFQPTFASCLYSYSPVAPIESRLDVTNVYASLVSRSEAVELGLTDASHEVLRVDVVGQAAEQIIGYDNSTNKLGGCRIRDGTFCLTARSDFVHRYDGRKYRRLLVDHMVVQLALPG